MINFPTPVSERSTPPLTDSSALDGWKTKTFAVAPMLDLTDRHCRAFLRILSPNVRLYTEMVVVGSMIHGDKDRFLGFDSSEHPVALQLGGAEPEKLAYCASLAEKWGYDEVNLNIGCPSDRVKNASFGACLMAKPEQVADCVQAMVEAVTIPVTVKTRLGIDELDSYEYLSDFIEVVSSRGCQTFLIHARKAWLKGLSPKENRTIPPLIYDRVYRLKQDFPDLTIILNGGVTSIQQMENHLHQVDGIMIGREAYQNPWILKEIDHCFFPESIHVSNDSLTISHCRNEVKTRIDAVHAYIPYIENQLSKDIYLRHMTRHMLGLFHGQPGAKGWRRYLSEFGSGKGAGLEVLFEALKFVDQPVEPKPSTAMDDHSERSMSMV